MSVLAHYFFFTFNIGERGNKTCIFLVQQMIAFWGTVAFLGILCGLPQGAGTERPQ